MRGHYPPGRLPFALDYASPRTGNQRGAWPRVARRAATEAAGAVAGRVSWGRPRLRDVCRDLLVLAASVGIAALFAWFMGSGLP